MTVLNISRLDSAHPDFKARLHALLAWEADQDAAIEAAVSAILADVRQRGDAALLEHTRRLDRLELASAADLEIPAAELQRALAELPAEQRTALQSAAGRIRAFHEHQLAQSWQYSEPDGTMLGQMIRPLDRVGVYVPGGKAAYPSSVLMNLLPAKVAGVPELVMVSPTPDGVRNPMVLAAAAVAGADRVYAIGGAQAIAALAWGTETIPAVDKIVGPGNAYVAEAKRRVFGTVGIDMIAGPSEILVIADGTTEPAWLAMDLFSQAEHDELAQAILLCPDPAYIEQVAAAMARLIGTMPRRAIIERSLADRGALIQVRDLAQACEIANEIAPEHLELAVAEPQRWVEHIRHAGAVFLGSWSSEALGDYCAGPNHVLPTMRTARFSSPLGVYDFQKRTSVLQVSAAAAPVLGALAATLADAEGLPAHAESARMRVRQSAQAPDGAGRSGESSPK